MMYVLLSLIVAINVTFNTCKTEKKDGYLAGDPTMKIKKSRLKQIIKEELDNLSFDTEEEDPNDPMYRLRDEIQDAVRDAMREIAIRELKGKVSQDKLASTVQEIEGEFEVPLMDALTPMAKGLMDEIAAAKGI